MEQSDLRQQLIVLLSWQDAHVNFDDAVEGIPTELQGVQPEGLPYSPWQLLEHIRLAQRDILDFCRDPAYESPKWHYNYWPKRNNPPTPEDRHDSIFEYREYRKILIEFEADPSLDLN